MNRTEAAARKSLVLPLRIIGATNRQLGDIRRNSPRFIAGE
jgi:hypothetical protein